MVRSSGAAYGHVKPVSVYRFYKVEATITVYYHTYVAVCVVTYNGMNPGVHCYPPFAVAAGFWPFPLSQMIIVKWVNDKQEWQI